MRARWTLFLLGCAACPGNSSETTDTATTTEPSTSSTSEPEPTGGTTGATTEPAPTTGETATTGDSTTGEPVRPGARVVYSTWGPTRELFFVDATGATPGAPVRVNAPLGEGWGAVSPRLSPTGRWLHYVQFHEQLGMEAWLVDMSGPEPGPARRIELPGSPSEVRVAALSADETRLAVQVSEPGGSQFHVCTIEPDGACAPEPWGVPLQPGGTQGVFFTFSPDNTRVAYLGDPDGDGLMELFLGGAGPGEAGIAVPVSGDAPPADDFGAAWFSQDGATLYYKFGPDPARQGVRAVDLTSDALKLPQTVVPSGGRFAVRSDGSAVLRWQPGEFFSIGDLSLFTLDGTVAGPAAPIHDEPARVSDGLFQWSTDERFALYGANNGGDSDAFALFAADVSGPTPAAPVRLSAPISTNGMVERVLVGADPSVVFYTGWPDFETGPQLWAVSPEAPGERVLLAQAELTGAILDVELGPAGSQVLFVSRDEVGAAAELFVVDAKAPGAPVRLSAPLAAGESALRPRFSPDGERAFYVERRVVDETMTHRLLQVDIAGPGEVLPLSDLAHDVNFGLFLPPVGE